MESTETKSLSESEKRERMLRVLAAITFLIFFQATWLHP